MNQATAPRARPLCVILDALGDDADGTLDKFLRSWSEADRKAVIVKALEENGVFFDELAKDVGKDYSPFDLVCTLRMTSPH
jgi:hypothetical protein